MVVERSLLEPMLVFLLLIASRKMHHIDHSEYLIARRSRRSMSSSNTRSFWYCLTRPSSPIRWKRWTPTRITQSLNVRGRSAMPISSSLVSAWANNWLPRSRHRLYRLRSRSSSRKRTWPTSRGSLVSPRCSRPDRTSSSLTRSSTSQQNLLPYTSCAPSSALGVRRDLKLSVSKHWRHSHCWIRLTPPWTSSCARRTSSRFISNAWRVNSSSATRTTPSLSTGMGGGLGQIGELHGRVLRRLLPFSIPTSLRLSPVSLKYGIWRAELLYISSQRRTLGGCTRQLERYVIELQDLQVQ